MITLTEILSGLGIEQLKKIAYNRGLLIEKDGNRKFIERLLLSELSKDNNMKKDFRSMGRAEMDIIIKAYTNGGYYPYDQGRDRAKERYFHVLMDKGFLFQIPDRGWVLPLEYFFMDDLPVNSSTSIIMTLRNLDAGLLKKIAQELGIGAGFSSNICSANIYSYVIKNRESVIAGLTDSEKLLVNKFIFGNESMYLYDYVKDNFNAKKTRSEYSYYYDDYRYSVSVYYDKKYNRHADLFLKMLIIPVMPKRGWTPECLAVSDEYMEIYTRESMRKIEGDIARAEKSLYVEKEPQKIVSYESRFVSDIKGLFLSMISINPRATKTSGVMFKKDRELISRLMGVETSYIDFLCAISRKNGWIEINDNEIYTVSNDGIRFVENGALRLSIKIFTGEISVSAGFDFLKEITRFFCERFINGINFCEYINLLAGYARLKKNRSDRGHYNFNGEMIINLIRQLSCLGLFEFEGILENIISFRPTKTFMDMLNDKEISLNITAEASRGKDTFIIQPNNDVLAELDMSFPLLLRLAQISKLIKVDKVIHFNLDILSLRTAIENGWTAKQIDSFLTSHNKYPIPQPIAHLLQDILRRDKEIEIKNASAYITINNPLIKDIVMNTPYIKEHADKMVGDTLILTEEAEAEDIVDLLRAKGYFVYYHEDNKDDDSKAMIGNSRGREENVYNMGSDEGKETGPVTDRDAIEEIMEIAMDTDEKVEIIYEGENGITKRVIEPYEWVDGDRVRAYCSLKDEERVFRLRHIQSARLIANM